MEEFCTLTWKNFVLFPVKHGRILYFNMEEFCTFPKRRAAIFFYHQNIFSAIGKGKNLFLS